jgi:hypothetical protein
MQQAVALAGLRSVPECKHSVTIAIIRIFTQRGILSVAKGVRIATGVIGWQLEDECSG